MITEMEKINYIIKKGAENSLTLAEFIDIQIKEFVDSPNYKAMEIGERYDNNESDIKNKRRTYIDEKGNEREAIYFANTKIKYPIVVKLKKQKTGYLLKKKMTLKEKQDEQNIDKKYMTNLNKFFNNKKHKLMKNTLNQSIVKGIAWWYIFIDDDFELNAKLRYAAEIIPIWEDREHEKLAAIIVRYFVTNYTKNKGKKIIEKVEYHDLDGIRFFVRDGEHLIPDIQKIEENKELQITTDEFENPVFAYFKINKTLKTWNKIPFIYWKYNSEEQPLIHLIKTLVDEVENLKSAVSDKLKDNVDGIHTVKGYSEEVEKFQKNLQTFKTIFLDEKGEYDFKQGTIDIEAFKTAIEQLRKDIYDIGGGVDTESDKFGNQQSGIALQQLYNDLDLDCSNIESEYQSSLEYFMFFFNTYQSLINSKDYSDKEVEFIFNKSMITDDTARITNIKNSEGIISRETQLANHPLVTDLEAEKERIKKENNAEEQANSDYSNLNKTNNEVNKDSDTDEK